MIGGFLAGVGLFLNSPILMPLSVTLVIFIIVAVIHLSRHKVLNIIGLSTSITRVRYKQRIKWLYNIGFGVTLGICWSNTYGVWVTQSTEVKRAALTQKTINVDAQVDSINVVHRKERLSGSAPEKSSSKEPIAQTLLNNKTDSERFQRITITITHIDGIAVSSVLPAQKVLVYIQDTDVSLHQGDRIKGRLKLRPISYLANQYGFDYQKYMFNIGVIATGRFVSESSNHNSFFLVRKDSSYRQTVLQDLLSQIYLVSPNLLKPGLVFALITGDKSLISNINRRQVLSWGVGHLFAISGLHIGIIYFVFFYFVKGVLFIAVRSFHYIFSYPLNGHRKKVGESNKAVPVISLVLLALYIWMIGAPPSAVRAFMAVSIWIFLSYGGIKFNRISALLVVAFAMVVFDPFIMLNIGWQLSFGAILGIIAFINIIKPFSGTRHNQHLAASANSNAILNIPIKTNGGGNFSKLIVHAILFQVFITLWMTPLLVVHFQYVSLLSVFNNLLATPIISLWVLPCLVISVLLHRLTYFSPQFFIPNADLDNVILSASEFLIRLADFSIYLLWRCLEIINQSTEVSFLSGVTGYVLLLVGLSIPVWVIFSLQSTKRRLGVFSIFLLSLIFVTNEAEQLIIFDVGQGSSALLTSKNQNFLVDLGPVYPNGSSATKRVIKPELVGIGIVKLDYFFITHFDADHKGTPNELALFGTKQPNDFTCSEVLNEVRSGISTNVYRIQKLWPPGNERLIFKQVFNSESRVNDSVKTAKLITNIDNSKDRNDGSCVLKITHKPTEIKTLFSGDISQRVERKLVNLHYENKVNLTSDIMISPHHGSAYSSSLPYIYAIKPSLVIHDSGYNNRFGFPKAEVFERYARYGIKQVSTARVGQVVVDFERFKIHKGLHHGVLNNWSPFWKKQNPFSFHGQIR